MSNTTTANTDMDTRQSGWVTFAGVMMIVAGLFQATAGLVAIFKPTLYVTTSSNLFVMDYTQWGWVHLIVGLIVALSAASLFAGHVWGKIVAITLAVLSAVLNFAFIWAYPLWSITIIIIDIMIIFAVLRHQAPEEF